MNSKRLWHLQERAASKEECQNLIRIHMGKHDNIFWDQRLR